MKRMSKSIKGYLLLAVVLCSVAANLFINYAVTHAATDPASLYIAPEVQKDATASLYRVGIALCMTNQGGYDLTSGNNSDEITPGDAASGKWFYGGDSYEVRPGILVWDKAHDYIDCSTFISSHPAAGALGFSDNIALACGVGLVRKDGKDCLNDPDQSNFTSKNIGGDKNKVYAAIDAHYKNASAPPSGGYNDAQRYVIVAKTLTDYCQATPKANVGGSKATPAIQAQYKDNKINVVDGNGEVTSVYFDIPDGGKKAYLGNFEGNFNWWEQSCGELVGFMNKYSGAYATYVKAHPQSQAPAPTTNPNNTGNDSPPTCVITGIGWIVCPVMRFMAQVTDQAYGVVSTMLTTPALDTSTGGDMYKAWSTMRNFANVAFVIAFLIIIYAQITGFGVTNYGIKKLLPRIIVAAILVNVSYWICAIAVDISNILGQSLSGLLEGTANQLFQQGKDFSQSGGGGGWDVLTVGIIATAAGVAILYAGLSVLAPLLLMALLAIVTVVVVLTARQALIILLIVVSPLAFVAYLLPNTESWFKKWRELFQSLLLMFPIIALVFGASKLASTVIMNSNKNPIVQIMGAGVTIIPLAITPLLMKTTTGVLGKIGGYVNNPNKGPFDRMRKGAAGYRENRQEYRKLKGMTGYRTLPGKGIAVRRASVRSAVLQNRKNELKRADANYIATLAQNNPKFVNKLAQGGGSGAQMRALAGAVNIKAKIEADEISAANVVMTNLNVNREDARKLSQGGSAAGLNGDEPAVRIAAMQRVINSHDTTGVNSLLDSVGSMDEKTRIAFADSLASSKEKPAYVSQSALNDIRQHGNDKIDPATGAPQIDPATGATVKVSAPSSTQLAVNAINNNTYSVDKIANGDKDELGFIAKVAADPTLATNNTNLSKNAQEALTNSRYAGQISKNKSEVEDLSML
jgi:hypothetical protein